MTPSDVSRCPPQEEALYFVRVRTILGYEQQSVLNLVTSADVLQ